MTEQPMAQAIENEIVRLEFSEYNAQGDLDSRGIPKNKQYLTVAQDRDPEIVVLGGGPRKLMVCTGSTLCKDLMTLPVGADWNTLITIIRQSLISEF
jgi:hypothetical protein